MILGVLQRGNSYEILILGVVCLKILDEESIKIDVFLYGLRKK